MKTHWVAAMTISGLLATGAPLSAQTDAPPAVPAPAAPNPPASPPAASPPGAGAGGPQAADVGSPNTSYPMKSGGTYHGPLNGQPGPTRKFYKGYNRT